MYEKRLGSSKPSIDLDALEQEYLSRKMKGEDEESKAELARRVQHWQEMAAAIGDHVDLK